MTDERAIPLDAIKLTWNSLHIDPQLRKRDLAPDIYESWQRAYRKDVPRFAKNFDNFASEAELRAALRESSQLLECALPVMESLSSYLRNTTFLVMLTNPELMVLKILGDKVPLAWARRTHIGEGTIWSEDLTGTNTGNLVMALKKPISLFAYEHFCLSSIVATSSGCPIMETGRILGGIGLVAPYTELNNDFTLGMTAVAAQQIQASMFLRKMDKYQTAILESMSEGVMVVDSQSRIVFINQECASILGFGSRSQILQKDLHDLLGDHPENSSFIEAITRASPLTDEFCVISRGKQRIKCTVTCAPICSTDTYLQGNVVILRKDERNTYLVKNWLGRSPKRSFQDIIGEDAAFRRTLAIAESAAATDSNILLLGESGTGKDIIAQAIHNASSRRDFPFIAINCAALPRDLLASELFGYEEGAFTGAKKGGNIGKFELANQGTIFLDEIGDMPLDLQVMLLRAVEEKCIIRLGDTKITPVDIRILCATNKDLESEIERKAFRLDLYYRLGVIKIEMPPLRARGNDIILLAEHFIEGICRRYDKNVKRLSGQAKRDLLSYSWPGNVRELQNVLESVVLLMKGDLIGPEDLRDYLRRPVRGHAGEETREDRPSNDGVSQSLPDLEEQLIRDYKERHKYGKEELMKLLGVSRRTLYRRLSRYK